MTRLSWITVPLARRRAGILLNGLSSISARSGLTGESWLSCNATRSCWPVSCSSTRTLRTKGEAGLWNSVMLGVDMQASSVNG
ncbi:hypothetical protein D3C78_1849570 [compost metagenome]